MPPAPAALFSSLNASSTDFDAAWPKRPAAPVSSTTTPTVCAHDGVCAVACATTMARDERTIAVRIGSAPSGLVEVVLHDPAVAAGLVAFERVGVALRPRVGTEPWRQQRMILVVELQ